MASQRHKREQHFFAKPDSADDPKPPQDSADETAAQYDEEPQWPDADRPA